MTRGDIKKGLAIIEKIDRLRATDNTLSVAFEKLKVEATDDEIQEFFALLVKLGYVKHLTSFMLNISSEINREIAILEKQLNAL